MIDAGPAMIYAGASPYDPPPIMKPLMPAFPAAVLMTSPPVVAPAGVDVDSLLIRADDG